MKFSTILADPPWPYHSPKAVIGNGGKGKKGAEKIKQVDLGNHYPTMSIKDIKALPVVNHINNNAHLYLWTTNSFMVEAHEVARAWGFVPKTILTWIKVKKDNTNSASMKTGYWYRSASEHIIFGVKGKLRLSGPAQPTAYMLPRLPHSVKPDFFYDLIENQSPQDYLELFARNIRKGWKAWGNEIVNSFEFSTTS